MIPQQLRAAPRALLIVSTLFFGAAYFTVRFPNAPGTEIASFVCTFLIALPSFFALWRFLGTQKATVSLLCLSAFGYAVEMVGVATGFPYGLFYYGDALGPKIAGLVPYLLLLSWVPLVLGAVAATAPERKIGYRRRVLWVLSAAILLTLVDGILDPGAASLGFWVWPEGGFYYGVPVSNYLGWLFSSSLATVILLRLGRRKWEGAQPPPELLDSAIIAVAFWTGVALFSGLLLPLVLGIILYLFLLTRRSYLAVLVESEARYKV
jgi:putative membrane protein